MIVEVFLVVLLQGLLSAAYPIDQQNSSLLPGSENVDTALQKDGIEFSKAMSSSVFTTEVNSNNNTVNNTTALQSEVGTVLSEKQADIDANLAEVDFIVEEELKKMETIVNTALANITIPDVDTNVDSNLENVEDEISTAVFMIDDVIKPEIEKIEDFVELVLENNTNIIKSELDASDIIIDIVDAERPVNSSLLEKESLTETDIADIQSFIDSELAKVDTFVEEELSKIDTFVEKELATVDARKEAELEKADASSKKEIDKIEDLIERKVNEVEAAVDSELTTIKVPEQRITKLDTAVSDKDCVAIEGIDNSQACEKNEDQNMVKPTIQVPVEGNVEFCGTAPASGSTLILGHTGPLQPDLNSQQKLSTAEINEPISESLQINSEKYSEQSLPFQPTTTEQKTLENATSTVILGCVLADDFLAGKEAEIERKLAEIDAMVEAEFEKMDELINTTLATAGIPKVDVLVNRDLQKVESEVASSIIFIDNIIAPELEKTGSLVKSVVENNTNAVKSELAEMEAQIDSVTDDFDSELIAVGYSEEPDTEKIKSFVDSELAKIDVFIEVELAKVDSFVQSELAKIEGLVKSETAKVESFVDEKLTSVAIAAGTNNEEVSAASEMLVHGVPDFGNEALDHENLQIEEGFATFPEFLNAEDKEEVGKEESPEELNYKAFKGTAKATGKTRILAHFPCAPLLPTETLNGKKFIWIARKRKNNGPSIPQSRLQTTENPPDYTSDDVPTYSVDFPETIINDSTKNYERFLDEYEGVSDGHFEDIPVKGEAYFEGTAPAYGSVYISGHTY